MNDEETFKWRSSHQRYPGHAYVDPILPDGLPILALVRFNDLAYLHHQTLPFGVQPKAIFVILKERKIKPDSCEVDPAEEEESRRFALDLAFTPKAGGRRGRSMSGSVWRRRWESTPSIPVLSRRGPTYAV